MAARDYAEMDEPTATERTETIADKIQRLSAELGEAGHELHEARAVYRKSAERSIRAEQRFDTTYREMCEAVIVMSNPTPTSAPPSPAYCR